MSAALAETEEELDLRFQAILQEHDAVTCPRCATPVDRGCVAWNNASTEYGTGYCVVEIACQACDTEIATVRSWYPEISDFRDVCYVLEKDWE